MTVVNTYTCDLDKLRDYLVGLGLPVEACVPGHSGFILVTSRNLEPNERELLSRVVVGPFGAFLAEVPTTALLSE